MTSDSSAVKRTLKPVGPKTHTLTASRLTFLYLRLALNNTGWMSGGLDDFESGMTALSAVPKVTTPPFTDDDKAFEWAAEPGTELTCEFSDAVRDTLRKALKHAFDKKLFPLNEYSHRLIADFSLRS